MRRHRALIAWTVVIAVAFLLVPPLMAEETGKININQASVEELSQLKRVGTKYAERIVQYREENGPFAKGEDITNVPGIGPKTWEDNKDKIAVE